MTPFLALLKREWLESRLAFLWLPLALLGFVVLMTLLGLAVSGSVDATIVITGDADALRFLDIDAWTDVELAARIAALRAAAAWPFWLVYMAAAAFVLLGSLYDERKDRSVLFFKSIPVSDAETVASKLVLVIGVAPLVTIAIILFAQVFLLLMLSIWASAQGVGGVSRLWWESGLVSGAGQLLIGYVIQGLWSLPVFAWLMLVSAVAPRLPLLWALLVPFAATLGEGIAFGSGTIGQSIRDHLKPVGLASAHEGIRAPLTLGDQLALFGTAELWLAVALGIALLYVAIRFRGINNEL